MINYQRKYSFFSADKDPAQTKGKHERGYKTSSSGIFLENLKVFNTCRWKFREPPKPGDESVDWGG